MSNVLTPKEWKYDNYPNIDWNDKRVSEYAVYYHSKMQEEKCKCSPDESTGWTQVAVCNVCGCDTVKYKEEHIKLPEYSKGGEYKRWDRGFNSCIDEVKRLNGIQ